MLGVDNLNTRATIGRVAFHYGQKNKNLEITYVIVRSPRQSSTPFSTIYGKIVYGVDEVCLRTNFTKSMVILFGARKLIGASFQTFKEVKFMMQMGLN